MTISTTTRMALIRRAIVLFPRRPYLNPAHVRHNRRQWVEAILKVASHPNRQLVQRQRSIDLTAHTF